MITTPHLVKPETQVNTTDGGTDQVEAAITPLHDGGYVVVWRDDSRTYNPLGEAVVGQRYDAAGNKIGGDLDHGGEVKLSHFTDGDQISPAVTTLANGEVALAFVDLFNGNHNIYVRVFDPSLQFVREDDIDLGPNQTVDPSLTALPDGGYVASYTVGDFSHMEVVARTVSAAGVVGDQFVLERPTGFPTEPQVAAHVATLSDGNVAAVYMNTFLGNNLDTDINFTILTPAGRQVGGGFVPGGETFGSENDPDLAALQGGGFVAVWREPTNDGADIHASIIANDGTATASDLLVNTTPAGPQDNPDVVALGDGGFLVTWEEDGMHDATRGQRFDALGHKIGTQFTLDTGGPPDQRDAALLSDGRIAFAFNTFAGDIGDFDVTTSILTASGQDGIGAVGAVVAGDFNGNEMQDYIWRDASADMTKWEYFATTQQVAQVDLGTVGFSWKILASDHFSNATPDQMLTQNVIDGTMTLWWVNNKQQLTGVNIGQNWNGIDYVANGHFADFGGAGVSNFLVTNTADHHLYDWWIDSNFKPQGIDLGAAWSNISFVGTGEFTPNGKTDFLVSNTVDHHLYDWWIDPASGTLQGFDLGAHWSNVGYIASGKFTENGGGKDNLLVFNQTDHHLYDWWIDAASGTLQGVDLGAHWSNIEFVTSGHFDNQTTNEQILVRNTVDNHLYEWWVDSTSHALAGIDLGAHPGIEFIDSRHFNNANGSTTNDELLVHNTADGHLYEWWIANNQLSGVDLMI
jgi:hypothetical protein